MSAQRLDVFGLYEALERDIQGCDKTWRDLGEETGISPSTFSRMKKGHAPSAHHLVTLLVRLNLGTSLNYLIKEA